jgi:hypothetical protein
MKLFLFFVLILRNKFANDIMDEFRKRTPEAFCDYLRERSSKARLQ